MLQSRCAENEDALRQKEAAQHELIQKLAQMARAQMSSCDAPSLPRLNAFDDFNSDLKLQVEAGRTLIDAIRQQLEDERERVAVLQKQLAREKEQVRLLGALLCLRMVVSSFCFSEGRASAAAHFVRGNTELTGAQAASDTVRGRSKAPVFFDFAVAFCCRRSAAQVRQAHQQFSFSHQQVHPTAKNVVLRC